MLTFSFLLLLITSAIYIFIASSIKRPWSIFPIMFSFFFLLKRDTKCVKLRLVVRAVWQHVMYRSVWGWELHFQGLTFSRRPLGRYHMLLPVIQGSKGSGNLPHPSSTQLSATLFPNPLPHTHTPRQSTWRLSHSNLTNSANSSFLWL